MTPNSLSFLFGLVTDKNHHLVCLFASRNFSSNETKSVAVSKLPRCLIIFRNVFPTSLGCRCSKTTQLSNSFQPHQSHTVRYCPTAPVTECSADNASASSARRSHTLILSGSGPFFGTCQHYQSYSPCVSALSKRRRSRRVDVHAHVTCAAALVCSHFILFLGRIFVSVCTFVSAVLCAGRRMKERRGLRQ